MRNSFASRVWRGLCLLAAWMLPLCATAQQKADSSPPPPPGQLVDVGGWRLHLNCTGEAKGTGPAVVLESGAGDFSFDWALVQPGVAGFARVCSYDRAGKAWSDLGPRPRSMRQVAYELREALKRAGVKGPYVLVGQSVGGLLARTFAREYLPDVAGMVLVDSTHEDTELFINGKVRRMRELSSGRAIPPVQTAITAADKELSADKRKEIEGFIKQTGPPRIGSPYDRLPPEIQQVRLWALARPENSESDNDPYWGEEFAEFFAARKAQEYPLGDRPLVVLVAGKSDQAPPNFTAEEWREFNAEKRRQKADLTQLSRNSRLIVDEQSGHHMQLDDPALVVEAVRQVVEAARRHTRLVSAESK